MTLRFQKPSLQLAALLLPALLSALRPALCFAQNPAVHADVTAKSTAAESSGSHMTVRAMPASETLHVLVGQSTILRGTGPMKRIYVGNPAVLQTYTSGPEEVVVTAKTPGVSSLVLWDAADQSCLYTVSADIDPAGLRQSLEAAYPRNVIVVQGTQDRLTLSGSVPTADVSEAVAKLAAGYSKDVVNSLRVVPIHGKQVQLKLRIAEADRTKLTQFGLNLAHAAGNNVGGITTGQFPSTTTLTPATSTTPASVTVSNSLNLSIFNFGHNLGATIQDLESKSILQILAEPTMTTMSGQAARFLSGGEFPFPVPQGTAGATAITIQFKPYGVKVDFTPTVNEDGSIRLKISPEVSSLDYSNAVSISGFTIPALTTRRAETEVELKDGQSFMLSGLLDRRVTDNISAMPGLSNIPILGQLFRSKNNNHTVTDLIIMVTVSVVDPLTAPASDAEPHWVVPNLDTDKFDKQVKTAPRTGDAN